MLAMPGAEVKLPSGTSPSTDMANYAVEENTHRLRLRRSFPELDVPDSHGRSLHVVRGYPNVVHHYL